MEKSENELSELVKVCSGWEQDFEFDFNLEITNPTKEQMRAAIAMLIDLNEYL